MQDFVIENGKLIKFNGKNIEVAYVPKGVVSIGEDAFNLADNKLKEIVISSTVKELESSSLSTVWAEKVVIPDTVEKIDDGVLFESVSLKYASIPSWMTKINVETFGLCTRLEEISKPNTVEEVCDSGFYRCNSLKSIDLTGVKKIGVYAFYECQCLKEVDLSTVTELGDCAFESCSGLKKVTLSNNIERIGEYTFWGCKNLTKIEIPKSVKFIGKYAFGDCTSLAEIRVPKDCILSENWNANCPAEVVYY